MSQSDEKTAAANIDQALKESLKKEIIDEVQAALAKKNFGQQILLLLLGFIFTGIVGSWLTSYWKDKEWKNQQLQLSRQRLIEQKYAVTDKITKGVAEAYVSAEDILYLADNGWEDKIPGEKAPARAMSWLQSSRDRRVSFELFGRDIAVNFTNPKAHALFQKISNNFDRVSGGIGYIHAVLKRNNWRKLKKGDKLGKGDKQDAVWVRDETFKILSHEVLDQMEELKKIMLEEIEDAAQRS